MNQKSVLRAAGFVLLAAAALSALVGGVLGNLLPDDPSQAANPLAMGSAVVEVVAGMALVIALPAIVVGLRLGVVGLIGTVLLQAAAMIFVVFFPMLQLVIFPWLVGVLNANQVQSGPPGFFTLFLVTQSVGLVAGVLIGMSMLARYRSMGIGFIVLSVLSALLGFAVSGGPLSGLSEVAVMIPLAWAAVELIRGRRQAASQALPTIDSPVAAS